MLSNPPYGKSWKNVNINGMPGGSEAEAERIEQQKKAMRLLTVPERKLYLALMARAAVREKQQTKAIEVPSRRVEPGNGGGE